MILSQETALAKHIKRAPLSGIYLLYGEESYLVQLYTKRMVELSVEHSARTFNLNRFEGKTVKVDELISAAEALPVFAPVRCIVVDDFAADGLSASDSDKLKELFADFPPQTLLIFSITGFVPDMKKSAKWRNFKTLVDKHGIVAALDRREGAQLIKFLQSYAKGRGKTLSSKTAQEILSRCSDNMAKLKNEMEKLCAYAKGEEITSQDVLAVTSEVVESSVFDIARALIRQDLKTALQKVDDLFYLREQPVSILAALSSSFVDLYRVSVFMKDGIPCSELSKYYNYKGREFRIRNAERDARKYHISFVRGCIRILSEADLALKSSRLEPRTVIEEALVKIMMLHAAGRTNR